MAYAETAFLFPGNPCSSSCPPVYLRYCKDWYLRSAALAELPSVKSTARCMPVPILQRIRHLQHRALACSFYSCACRGSPICCLHCHIEKAEIYIGYLNKGVRAYVLIKSYTKEAQPLWVALLYFACVRRYGSFQHKNPPKNMEALQTECLPYSLLFLFTMRR